MAQKILERTTFKTSRLLEFFTEKELTMQLGHGRAMWPVAILKELIDNALDACETANIPPKVKVVITRGTMSVQDNGPGLPEKTLDRSLDYLVRVSEALIAAYVAAERDGNRARTVREFVSEFAGLSGSAKQKAVTEAAGLVGAYLHDLVSGDHIDLTSVARLLAAMREHSRPVKAKQLGEIGEAHLRGWLAQHWCDADSVTYRRKLGEADGVPFVLEVALGIHRDEYAENRGSRVTGLNWAPTVGAPIAELAVRVGRLRSRDLTNAT